MCKKNKNAEKTSCDITKQAPIDERVFVQ